MVPASVAAEAAGSQVAEPEARAKKQRLVLDKAYGYFVLELDESSNMTRQLSRELHIPCAEWHEGYRLGGEGGRVLGGVPCYPWKVCLGR